MELQIQDLVSSIRKEGIDAAKAEAVATSDEIKQQASEKINAAKLEIAKKLVESASAETK